MKTLADLLDQHEPAFPTLREWANNPSGNGAMLLTPDFEAGAQTLVSLQVTTRSMLGAMAYETGGVSVNDGLVRLLGSGAERSLLRTAEQAGCPLDGRYPDVIIVGDDAFGGVFALNGGRFGAGEPGEVFHLAADEVAWSPLGIGYAAFVGWCLVGDLGRLYGSFAELDAYKARPRPGFDETYSFYPFLWTREGKTGRPDVRVIKAEESLRLRLELCGFEVGP